MKYFHLKWDEVMWGISWANLVMLQATIPVIDRGEDSGGDFTSPEKEINSPMAFKEFLGM